MRYTRARSFVVLVVAFVAFMAATLRAPFVPAARAGVASVERASSERADAQALVVSPPVLRRAVSIRPTGDGPPPVALHAATALVSRYAWSCTDASVIAERTWVPSAKTRAELMVFLN